MIRSESGRFARLAERINQDSAGGSVTQGNAGAIDAADDGRSTGDLGDLSGFTETQFTNVLLEAPLPHEFTDLSTGSSRKLAEGAGLGWVGGCHGKETTNELRTSINVNWLVVTTATKKRTSGRGAF